MNIQVSVEKPSSIRRKLTIKVPALEVSKRFERTLGEVQKTAKLKGFRPGTAPLSIVKQFYGADVRHNLLHRLIDEAFQNAVVQEKLKAVGSPQIETGDEHKTGAGEHDHTIDETKDFTFTATVDILPEIEVKGYTGLALTKDSDKVTKEDIEKTISQVLDSQSSLTTVADAKAKAKKGEFVDMDFAGGVVTEKGLDERPGMKGSRLLEIGSDQLIEGFEEQLIGMVKGETKTFQLPFPKDYFEADLAGKTAEFTVTVKEIKRKEMPELTDEIAKQVGYESVADLKAKAEAHLTNQKKTDSDRKLRSDLLAQIIEKNAFECPQSLVQAQTRALANDVAQNLKSQGFNDQMIQEAIGSELPNLAKRAENQVRASLILEAIAKKEDIKVDSKDVDAEMSNMAKSMRVEEDKVREFYLANPNRRDDFEYKIREEKTMKFLLEKSKIKTA